MTVNRTAIYQAWSDTFKDVYGVRPRGYMEDLKSMSDEELEDSYNSLCDSVIAVIAEEKAEKEAAKIEWNARIEKMMTDFNIDRPRALRWDAEASGSDARYGWDHYCWENGLPYEISAELEELLPSRLLIKEYQE